MFNYNLVASRQFLEHNFGWSIFKVIIEIICQIIIKTKYSVGGTSVSYGFSVDTRISMNNCNEMESIE